MAKLAILDNLGCAIRGSKEPLVGILAQELLGRDVAAHELLFGHLNLAESAIHPSHIAMLTAVDAHAIDFDDTFLPAHAAHAGATVIGAVFALAPTQPTANV